MIANHIINALRFELSNVTIPAIRQRMVNILSMIDKSLATSVADALGLKVQKPEQPVNHSIPADGKPSEFQPIKARQAVQSSQALSMAGTVKDSIATRQVAILVADGVDIAAVQNMASKLQRKGAQVKTIGPLLGQVKGADGHLLDVDKALFNTSSVLFDAVYIPGGVASADRLAAEPDALHFVSQAYKHCKAIATDKDAAHILEKSAIVYNNEDAGIITNGKAETFIKAIASHRFWEREEERKVPA